MEDQKDRFGEKLKLVERAREDIYFSERDRELIEKLKARLKRVEKPEGKEPPLACPKCQGTLESYVFMEIFLDRCQACGGLWLDKGELDGILKKIQRDPLSSFVDRIISRRPETSGEKETG